VTSSAAAASPRRPTIAICLTTHQRLDCARIGMEIIRYNYPGEWKIVHACSGSGYEQYLEDELVRCEPKPLTEGALNLLLQSFRRAVDRWNPDYLVHLEGDTWVLDHQVLLKYIGLLERDPAAMIAASSWNVDKLRLWQWRWRQERSLISAAKYRLALWLRPRGIQFGLRERDTLSTQFFIVKNRPQTMELLEQLDPSSGYILENVLYKSVVRRFGTAAIVGIPESEPLRPDHRWLCRALTLYGQHWPTTIADPDPGRLPDPASHYGIPGKKETLQQATWLKRGPHMERLLTDPDLGYYNGRAARH